MFHDSDFLRKFLSVFEAIWEPLEHRQNHLPMYFDLRTCPPQWLPWIASWFGLAVREEWPEARVRGLVAELFKLHQWRGTAFGLERMLEVCAGVKAEVRESPTDRFVFHVSVQLPPDAPADLLGSVHALIASNKPAHAGYVLEVRP